MTFSEHKGICKTLLRNCKIFLSADIMTKELQQLQYHDVLTDWASAMEERGTRNVLFDFKSNYPSHFREMQAQINRLDQRQVPKLLTKDE